MNIISSFFQTRNADADARVGIDSTETRLVAKLGVRPDPSTDPDYLAALSMLADRARLDELREDITRAEDAAAGGQAPWVYSLGLLAAGLVEFVGAMLLMAALNVAEGHRIFLAGALAASLFAITALLGHRASSTSAGGAQGGGAGTGRAGPTLHGQSGSGSRWSEVARVAKRSVGTLFLLSAYAVVVVAITVIRIGSSIGDEGASLPEIVAQGVLLLATAVGPAWCLEFLMRRRAVAKRRHDHLKNLRRRLKKGEAETKLAREKVNHFARSVDGWDNESARLRAQYQTAHRLETARLAKQAEVEARRLAALPKTDERIEP